MGDKITFLDCCENNYYENESLEIGASNGCITIIAGTEHYDKHVKNLGINGIEKIKKEYIETREKPDAEKIEFLEEVIEDKKKIHAYLGKCECGNLVYVSKKVLYAKEHNSCGRNCKLHK